MYSFKLWTESEVELLIQLKSDFLTNKEIALKLNRSLSSVRNKILEVRKHTAIESIQNPWDSSEIKRLINLRNSKIKWKEISSILNRSENSCREKYKRL